MITKLNAIKKGGAIDTVYPNKIQSSPIMDNIPSIAGTSRVTIKPNLVFPTSSLTPITIRPKPSNRKRRDVRSVMPTLNSSGANNLKRMFNP